MLLLLADHPPAAVDLQHNRRAGRLVAVVEHVELEPLAARVVGQLAGGGDVNVGHPERVDQRAPGRDEISGLGDARQPLRVFVAERFAQRVLDLDPGALPAADQRGVAGCGDGGRGESARARRASRAARP